MKKGMVALAMLMLVGTAFAAAPDNGLTKGKVTHLYLYEKDPSTWSIVDGGAWGKLTYKALGGQYVFNGHGVTPGTEYTLINYCRIGTEWPPTIVALDSGVADVYGDVHIQGVIPSELCEDTTPGSGGVKIWLVPTTAVGEDHLIGWAPADYLFEYATL